MLKARQTHLATCRRYECVRRDPPDESLSHQRSIAITDALAVSRVTGADTKLRGPALIGVDQLHIDLRHVVPLMHDLCAGLPIHFFLSRDLLSDPLLRLFPVRGGHLSGPQRLLSVFEDGLVPGGRFQIRLIPGKLCPESLHQVQLLGKRKAGNGQFNSFHSVFLFPSVGTFYRNAPAESTRAAANSYLRIDRDSAAEVTERPSAATKSACQRNKMLRLCSTSTVTDLS